MEFKLKLNQLAKYIKRISELICIYIYKTGKSLICCSCKKKENIHGALNYLKTGLSYPNYKSIIQEQLLRIQYHPDQDYWIRSLEMLMPHISGDMFIDLFKQSKDQHIINNIDMKLIEKHHFQSIILYLTDLRLTAKMKKTEEIEIESISKIIDPSSEQINDNIQKKGGLGFFGYIIVLTIITLSIVGVLKTFENELIIYFPEVEYIFDKGEYIFESMGYIITIVNDLINSY